jgi:hypothetical protein
MSKQKFLFPVGEKTLSEYQRQVKNTKAKIRRVKKNYGIDLTDEIEIPSLESISSRKAFNEWKQKVESFRNKANTHYQFEKNQYDVAVSKKRIHDIEHNTKVAQQNADEMIKKKMDKPFISGGKVQGTQGQRLLQMGKPNVMGITRPKDFDFQSIRNMKRFEEVEKNARKRANGEFYNERMDKMRESYIEQLEKAFNTDADSLVKKLREMPLDDFYELYDLIDEFDFNVFYQMEGVNDSSVSDFVITQLESYVNQYYKGEIDLSLKAIPNRR